MWIARARFGAVSLWYKKPHYNSFLEEWVGDGKHCILYAEADKDLPKNLTFENSPMEVKFKQKEE